MTSSILPPRSSRADCSPRTHRTESETLDLPQPFGPTIAVTPSSKVSVTVSAKDLKPESSSLVSFMPSVSLGRWVKLLRLGLVLSPDDEGRHADGAAGRLRLLPSRIGPEHDSVHVLAAAGCQHRCRQARRPQLGRELVGPCWVL